MYNDKPTGIYLLTVIYRTGHSALWCCGMADKRAACL